MGQDGRGRGSRSGGIASLVAIVDEYGGALDYDLITRTRYTLSDLGGPLDWVTLLHFVHNLDCRSALVRAMNPELREHYEWMAGERNAAIMADLIDAINALRWETACAHTPKGKSKPKRIPIYPRPGMERQSGKGEKVIGSEPIPVSEFDAWWDSMNEVEDEESEEDEQGVSTPCQT